MSNDSIVIVDGARTPMGGLLGSLSAVAAPELASTAIAAAIARSGIDAADVDEVFMGCVLPAGLKQCPARQAAIGAGIPTSSGAVTLNKACGSGMQATIFGYDSIVAGTNKIVVTGGMESMTNAPHLLPGARGGVGSSHKTIYDHMFMDGLEDAYTGRAMGSFAQETVDERGITREQMDAFAIESLTRAKAAIDDGSLKGQIAPVTVKTRKGETVVADDEQPHKALIPMARIVAHSRHSQAPNEFTVAPIGAINKLFEKTGWSVEDVDLFEINEAFAMVTMLAMADLGLDHAKVNVHGGACAQGHPIGSTGSRIIVSLMYALKQLGKKRGVAALCIGGGEATAVGIELI
jgi:acetyl-CoA C-acetyltransferase